MHVEISERRPRFVTNWILSMLSWNPLCLAFVATPIIVHGLGAEQYGIYAIVLGFLSYAFSSGIGKVAGKYIPEFRASGESKKLSQAVSAALWLTLSVGISDTVVLIAAAPYIVRDILLIPAENAEIVLKALYVAAFSGLVLMVGQVFQFSLQGLHRFGRFAVVTNISAVLSAAGNIWLVLNGYGVLPLIAWNAAVACISGIIFFATLRPLLPEWRPGFAINREISRLVRANARKHLLHIRHRQACSCSSNGRGPLRKFGSEALSFHVLPMMSAVYMHGLLGKFCRFYFQSRG